MAAAIMQASKRNLNDYYLSMLTGDEEALRLLVLYTFDNMK